MKSLLFLLCLASIGLLQGCCAHCVGTNRVDCDKTLQCDLQRLLAIDEYSIEYMRNSFYCSPMLMEQTLQTQAEASIIPAEHYSTHQPAASEPIYKDLTIPGWNSGRRGPARPSAGPGAGPSDGPAK